MNSNLFAKSLQGVLSLKLFKLDRSVLIEEFIYTEVSSSNSDLDAVVFNFNCNSLGSKLVYSLSLSHKHDLELSPLWVVVDKLSQFFINDIILDRNVDSNPLLQINDILLESLNFTLSILQLFEQLQRSFICFVYFFLQLQDIVSGVI